MCPLKWLGFPDGSERHFARFNVRLSVHLKNDSPSFYAARLRLGYNDRGLVARGRRSLGTAPENHRQCGCSEPSCSCQGECQLPATKFIKCATIELLCDGCAEYALNSYDGAREVRPIDERWQQFAHQHPYWAKFLGRMPRAILAVWLRDTMT